MLKKVLKKNNLELFLRFDLLGAKQTVHLVRILTFAQYAEFMILNENVLQLQLLQETFNPGGLADGGWHQIGLTFFGGKASLRSDLEEVTAQIGQSIRTGIRLEWRVLKTNVFFHGTPWAYFCSQKNWSKVASNAIFCHQAQASLWPAGPRWMVGKVQFSWVNFSRLASCLQRSARCEILTFLADRQRDSSSQNHYSPTNKVTFSLQTHSCYYI